MSEEKTRCIACKESIWVDATICPQCQTHQKKQFRRSLLLSLKELGAVTVIFSLIFAVMELNRFTDLWFENSAAVSRLASSASMLIEAGEYSSARKLLTDAKKISPASEEVNILQMQLAMISIRKIGSPNSSAEKQILINSRDVLYHNLGRENKSDAAVLAHIAWAGYSLAQGRRVKVDVNLYLDKALALDETSVYANAYKGYWYLTVYPYLQLKNSLTDAEITMKAQKYFNVALQQKIDSDYIQKLQLWALNRYSNQASSAEYLKLVLTMYTNNNEHFLKNQKQLLSDLYQQFYTAIREAVASKDAYQKNVYLTQSKQVINTLKKINKTYPTNAHYESMPIILLAIANEQKGNYLPAIKGYINAYKIVKETMSSFRYDLPVFLKRICTNPENLDAASITQCDYFFADVVKSNH